MIRKAINSDAENIHCLLKQIAQLHHELYPNRFTQGVKYTLEMVKALISAEDKLVLVSENQGFEGYVIALRQYPTLFIDDICVDHSQRGKQIGEKLVDAVYEYGKKEGFEEVTLNVWDRNVGARKFYDRLGFEPLKTVLSKPIK